MGGVVEKERQAAGDVGDGAECAGVAAGDVEDVGEFTDEALPGEDARIGGGEVGLHEIVARDRVATEESRRPISPDWCRR